MSKFRLSRRSDIGGKLRVSFEFFPPKSDEMEARLWETVQRLEPLNPNFVSVTYGAGGSTRERTARTIRRVLDGSTLAPAAHMTCVDASREEVDAVIADFVAMGVKRFVALRGDPAEGVGARYRPHPQGYANAALTGPNAKNPEWIGLENYTTLFADPLFPQSLLLTVVFVLVSAVIGQNFLGLGLALLMQRAHKAVAAVVGVCVVAAWVLPEIVAAFVAYAFFFRLCGRGLD